MKKTLITLLLLLPSCGLADNYLARKTAEYQRRQDAAWKELRGERRTLAAEKERTTEPLTNEQERAIVRVTLPFLRDPQSAKFRFKGTSYECRGNRVASFYLNARNGFGGLTGFQQWYAIFEDGRVKLTNSGFYR